MKRIIFIIYTLVIASVATWAQPRITSNKEVHHFGQIEWKQPVTVEYIVTNTGDAPLVFTNITTSCACAVADWTQTPIMPGEKGMVRATFDAKMLGHFRKSVGIYSNATPNLLYLYFEGEVVQEITDFGNQHPYTIEQIQISRNELEFPDVHLGEDPEITLSVVNLSDRPYEPVLMHLPPYIEMKRDANVLLKGERGRITLTLRTDKLPGLGLTQTSVYLSRFAGDKVNDENEIPVSVVLLPDLDRTISRENAPVIALSDTVADLRKKLEKKNKANYDITLTNNGKLPLEVKKLQVFDPAVGVDLKKNLLYPGEKTRLRISVNKQLLNKKKHPRILIITNDPENPKVTIDIVVKKQQVITEATGE
ncbi:DUF1573 domain-containing protein [Bacteroides sp. OttesenSCG-928-E20]|nr:DUF1573 domain-containing protein [Bacteroides sp. OttesenSCG-928-N06]MDL2299342.1 DUF1573 domain-containing protein [Bacteroides sp. OttesenSCG-928-E20]MDL2304680.1 DUF1573 domain-containing protein [Bacteroides sp. OttesenSCG-928-D19]